MTRQCRNMFESLIPTVRSNSGVKAILLSNKFSKKRLSEKSVSEMLEFWSAAGTPLVVFTAMPEFPRFAEQVAMRAASGGPKTSEGYYMDSVHAEHSIAVLNEQSRSGLFVVDMEQVFCSLGSTSCSPYLGTEPLLVDSSHLSPLGMRQVGLKLVKDQNIFQYLSH